MTFQTLHQYLKQNLLHAEAIIPVSVGIMIGAAFLLFPPNVVLLGAAGIAGLITIALRPELGILFIVVVTGNLINPDQLPLINLGLFSLHLTDLILLVLLAKVVMRVLIFRKTNLIQTPLDFPIFWFSLAAWVSVLVAMVNPSSGISFILRRYRPIAYYLVFFTVTNLIVKKQQLYTLIYGLVIIAVLASALMLAQVIDPSLQIINTRSESLITAGQNFTEIERVYFQGDRIMYSALLIILVSFIIKANIFPAWLEYIFIGIIGIGEFLTFQRNYWLSLSAMTFLLFILITRIQRIRFVKWLFLTLSIFILAINLSGFPIHYWNAAVDRITRGMEVQTLVQDTSTQYRVQEIKSALESIVAKPILGIGLGNYYRPAFQYEDPGNNEKNLRWYLHNSYLWVWMAMGLFGLIPFLWFYSSAIVRALSNWRRVSDLCLRAFVLGSGLALLGQAISNIVAPNFIQTWVLVIFPILIGMNEVIFKSGLKDGNGGKSYV